MNRAARLTSLAIIALIASGCRVGPSPLVINWPTDVGVSADSIIAIYKRYYGATPRSLGSCGPRQIIVAFDDPPGSLRASGPQPTPPVDYAVDIGIVRANAGAATTIGMLAWYAVERSQAVDTITVRMRTADDSEGDFVFVPDTSSHLQPLRLVGQRGRSCLTAF